MYNRIGKNHNISSLLFHRPFICTYILYFNAMDDHRLNAVEDIQNNILCFPQNFVCQFHPFPTFWYKSIDLNYWDVWLSHCMSSNSYCIEFVVIFFFKCENVHLNCSPHIFCIALKIEMEMFGFRRVIDVLRFSIV